MTHELATTERLWKDLSDRLRSFLRRRVSDEQTAEDLLQETFVRIHRRLDGVRDTERIDSWVFQIARNLLADHYRAKSRETQKLADDIGDEVEEQGNLNELVAGWLPEMIRQLPETYRDALELYELEGLSQQEIADRLGISLSGAKSRVQRGRTKLKSLLMDCCSFESDRRGNVIDYSPNASQNDSDCGC